MKNNISYFKRSREDWQGKKPQKDNEHTIYKYSVYMQSRDSQWLNRNITNHRVDEDPEPIEEDIRD